MAIDNNKDKTYPRQQMYDDTNSTTLPSNLKPDVVLNDQVFNAAGLYSKSDINQARFSRFSRFGRILDPYGRLNPCREYLFFVKPDLHIVVPDGLISNPVYSINSFAKDELYTANGLTMNPQLTNNPYFQDLINFRPNVVKELQYSAQTKDHINPFGHLLSFSVSSSLQLGSSTAETLDNPATVYGTTYKYLRDSEASDEEYSFSLEFVDNKNLDTYHFFKAYSEYHIARKTGFVTPPNYDYYRYKRLHNTMGIYKFIVSEDAETLIYWAYLWGVYPTTVPRDAFSDPTFSDGLTFSVDFNAAFIEDMNPVILYQFNNLMKPVMDSYGCKINQWIPTIRQNRTSPYINLYGKNGAETIPNPGYDPTVGAPPDLRTKNYQGFSTTGMADQIDGTLAIAAYIDSRRMDGDTGPKYRLRWYAPESKVNTY